MLFPGGAIHDPGKGEVWHKTFPPRAPRLSLNCAFFRTGRRNCMEAGAELITGRKVRSKNRNQRGNQKRRNNGHGGTEFCESRAMGAGLYLFLNAADGIELWLVDLPFEGSQFFAGCVCRRACCRGPGRSDSLRPSVRDCGAEPCHPPGRTHAPRAVVARGFETEDCRGHLPPAACHALSHPPRPPPPAPHT